MIKYVLEFCAPHGARRRCRGSQSHIADFNPRAPHGARRNGPAMEAVNDSISIHAPRMGRDTAPWPGPDRKKDFNPRAPCGARRHALIVLALQRLISIHAPRMGRDFFLQTYLLARLQISIHAPRMGRDATLSLFWRSSA